MPEGITNLDEAIKEINRGNKMSLYGGILSGIGDLADAVNAIYQTSKGRIPIPIGRPLSAVGKSVAGYGEARTKQGQQKSALATIEGIPDLDETQKGLLYGSIMSGEPGAAYKGAFNVLAAKEQQPYKDLMTSLATQRLDLANQAEQRLQNQQTRLENKFDLDQRKVAAKYNDYINSTKTLSKGLDEVLQLGNSLSQGRAGGLYEKTKGLIANPKLKKFEATKQTLLTNVARSLGGEKGPLSDTDVKIWKNTLTSVYDTPEERKAAYDSLKSLMINRTQEWRDNTEFATGRSFESFNVTPQGAVGTQTGSDGNEYYVDKDGKILGGVK